MSSLPIPSLATLPNGPSVAGFHLARRCSGKRSRRELFVLLHGRLRVTQVTQAGEQIVVRMINPGDLFGIAQALRLSTYPGTATAVVESVALSWPMSDWDEMVTRYPSFAATTIQTIGARLQDAHARIREMSTEAVEQRLGHAVLRLAQQSGRPEPGGIRIDFPVSKQDLAEMSGTTLYTVSRMLAAWEGAGLVDGGRQKLLVKNPPRSAVDRRWHRTRPFALEGTLLD